jgi:DNA-binding response OmpR family regulator
MRSLKAWTYRRTYARQAGNRGIMRILLAEDDSIIADGLCRSLRQGGYAIDCAYNGIDADTALLTNTYDLLILDLGLPKTTGAGRAAAPAGPPVEARRY